MSLLRRWFDPIRSSWFYQKPSRQAVLSTEQGLSIYLRLDDVYSYLAVQQLTQLDDILTDEIKPLKVIISHQGAEPPNGMTALEWQNYCFNDAKILAKQHRFSFDETPEPPTSEALSQAELILKNTPLQGKNFLYLPENAAYTKDPSLWSRPPEECHTWHRHAAPQGCCNIILPSLAWLVGSDGKMG